MRQPTRSATDQLLGRQLVRAVVSKDAGALRALFSTPVVFRAVTPRRFFDAETAIGVVDVVLGVWFGPDRTVTGVAFVETDAVADVNKVSYRLEVDGSSGPTVVEQVAYYSAQDGRITAMRLICSGFQPRD
jgi:hypothetical protein